MSERSIKSLPALFKPVCSDSASRKEKATRPCRRFERSRYKRRLTSPQSNVRAEVSDDDQKELKLGHPEVLSGLTSSLV